METAPRNEAGVIPVPYRVSRVRRETADVRTIELRAVERDGGLRFVPGQYAMLYAPGVGEVPISISGDPLRAALVQTVRAVGAVTAALCAARPGALLGVRGPYGRGWPVEAMEGRDVVLVAGGLGLAPLRPALYHALSRREAIGRIVLLYGARSPGELLYARELEKLRARFDLQVEVTVDSAAGSWRGVVGPVTTLVPRAVFDPEDCLALVCGPEVMMRFAVEALRRRGVPESAIHVSAERNMHCAVGLCGHCQLGPLFVCRDGPVLSWPEVAPWLRTREL